MKNKQKDKYYHKINLDDYYNTEVPENNRQVLFIKEDNGHLKMKLFEMTPVTWALNKGNFNGWMYFDEIMTDVKDLVKYLRAYNLFRDTIKELLDEDIESSVRSKLEETLERARNLVSGE